MRGATIIAADMRGIPRRIAPRSHLGQDCVQALGFACQSIFRLGRPKQQLNDALTLAGGTVGQISSSHRGPQPIDRQTYPFLLQQNRTPRPVGFSDLHVIASRHHQIGRPGYPRAQPLKDRRGGLGDTIPVLPAGRRLRKRSTDPVASIAKPPCHETRARKRMKNSQQARLRNGRQHMQLVQRRIRLHLQGLKHPQPSLQPFDDLRTRHSTRSEAFRNPERSIPHCGTHVDCSGGCND